MSLSEPIVNIEKSVGKYQPMMRHVKCSKSFHSVNQSSAAATGIWPLDLTCKTSLCADNMEFRYGVCKYDTRLLFNVDDENQPFTQTEARAIPKLWQCFLQNWLHVDLGNRTSYFILMSRNQSEEVHVSNIQIFVTDKEELNTAMRSGYMKSAVLFLTGELGKYRKKYTGGQHKSSAAQEKIVYCYDWSYDSSGQESQNRNLPACHEDFLVNLSKSLVTTDIEQCLAQLMETVNADSSSSSMICFAPVPMMMAAVVFISRHRITQSVMCQLFDF